ncbi:MAG: RluA family pseudouridine synthase [Christensenellaceae bacterium]
MIKLEITQESDGYKVTQCVAAYLPELQSLNLKKMMRSGDIKLNGYRIKKDFAVEDGDVIEVYMPVEYERSATLDIVYEDKNLIILNKQPGTVVAGNVDENTPELMSMVINYLKGKQEYSEKSGCIPFACFKLDIFTGGLVMFAKNGDIFEFVREAIAQRRIKRTFEAIIKGRPDYDRGEFQHFYVKDSDEKYRVSNTKIRGAVPIYTKYNVLKSNDIYSFVEIEPVTQYVNQERAHMEAAGFPILGDAIYGEPKLNKKLGIKYQALWATKIEFTTGVNNVLEYLNGKQVRTRDVNFPIVNLEE